MSIELYHEVVLNKDIPQASLRRGDVATLVDYAPHPHGGEEGAILELFNALDESVRVVTVPVSAIEALRPDHMPAVRIMGDNIQV